MLYMNKLIAALLVLIFIPMDSFAGCNDAYSEGYDAAYEGEASRHYDYYSPHKDCYEAGFRDGNLDADCEWYRLRDNYYYWKELGCNNRPYEPKSWSDR